MGESQGLDLEYSATLTGSSFCCNNFFSGKPMHNFTFTLTIENKSDLMYYVKIEREGEVQALYDLPDSKELKEIYGLSGRVIVNTNFKKVTLYPGQKISYDAYSDMGRSDFYPIDAEQHDKQLKKNPNSFNPNFVKVMVWRQGYSKQKIKEINANITANATKVHLSVPNKTKTNNTTNNNAVNNENNADFSSVMDDLEASFDGNISLEDISLETLSKTLPSVKESSTQEKSLISEPTEKHTYDQSLCTTLTNEYSNLLHKYDQTDKSVSQVDVIYQMRDFIIRKNEELKKKNLAPQCDREIQKMGTEFFKQKMVQHDKEYNEIMKKHGHYLNGIPVPNDNTTRSNQPTFAPATMTKTYTKKQGSNSSSTGKLNTGATQSADKRKLKY